MRLQNITNYSKKEWNQKNYNLFKTSVKAVKTVIYELKQMNEGKICPFIISISPPPPPIIITGSQSEKRPKFWGLF